MKAIRLSLAVVALSLAAASLPSAEDGLLEDRVLDFPSGYRQDFTEYFRGDRVYHHDQTIRIYANAIALDAAKAGESPPDGSLLVAEVFSALKDDEGAVLESIIGRRLPSAMKLIAVMERRAGWDAQYPEDLKVGDWEFEVFSPSGKNLGKDTTGCRACHHPLADSDYLFSIEHLAVAE